MATTSVKTAIAVILLIQLTRSHTQSPNIEFLNKLFEDKLNEVETMVILQHHQDRNCELKDWNSHEIPTLRYNQLARVEVRRHFNTLALGLVCITKDSQLSLLDTMAEIFDGMRQVPIILWIQKEVTQEMLKHISHQAKLYQYLQILILEVSRKQGEILSAHRFQAVPNSEIVQVDKTVGFPKIAIDFTGRVASVLTEYAVVSPNGRFSDNILEPIQWKRTEHPIVLFARKYNLTLNFIPSVNVTPDILLTPQMSSIKMDLKYLSPYDLNELKVVVPCSRMRTIGDVFKQLDIKCLLYILPVYATFVAMETIILLVTHRINGRAYQLTSLNPLLNLRAFRAILGLSFPISRRANPSLRQLFLAISVFGLIFSNFYSCKLTALFTKHPHHPQVTNFHELRASGLAVIVNSRIRTYIENEIDPNFLNKTIIRVNEVSISEKTRLMLSLNDSYAFVVASDYWRLLENYQKSLRRRVLCDSKELTIIHGMPKMHVLHKNSIFDWPVSKFLWRIHETGINKHWENQAPYILQKLLNVTLGIKPLRKEIPLGIADFNWLWLLLGCGYGLATFVFIIELTLRGLRKNNKRQEPRENVLVA